MPEVKPPLVMFCLGGGYQLPFTTVNSMPFRAHVCSLSWRIPSIEPAHLTAANGNHERSNHG